MSRSVRSYAWRGMTALAVLGLAACSSGGTGGSTATDPVQAPSTVIAPQTPENTSGPSKVMIIAEENKTYGEVLGSDQAPYLKGLAAAHGSAVNMQAGYPAQCPSLAAYIILTSGSDHGICDDAPPAAHRLTGDDVFQQVTRSGREWRAYAESMPANCTLADDGRYLVRHAPAGYYLGSRKLCARWQVPLGSPGRGALHDAVTAGTLPAYSFVSPDACNDMHGGPACGSAEIATGDAWLSTWMPLLMAGPDYRSGRLVVVITWDEGSPTSNRIPTLVVSTHAGHASPTTGFTHCSTLRTVEEVLKLPLLSCARTAISMRPAFGL